MLTEASWHSAYPEEASGMPSRSVSCRISPAGSHVRTHSSPGTRTPITPCVAAVPVPAVMHLELAWGQPAQPPSHSLMSSPLMKGRASHLRPCCKIPSPAARRWLQAVPPRHSCRPTPPGAEVTSKEPEHSQCHLQGRHTQGMGLMMSGGCGAQPGTRRARLPQEGRSTTNSFSGSALRESFGCLCILWETRSRQRARRAQQPTTSTPQGQGWRRTPPSRTPLWMEAELRAGQAP